MGLLVAAEAKKTTLGLLKLELDSGANQTQPLIDEPSQSQENLKSHAYFGVHK